MKAIVLATAATIVLLLIVTLAFQLAPARSRVRQMALLYLACAVGLIVAWLVTPDNLGVLPRSLLTEPRWLDLALALFFFSAAFFGGVLQLYNLADRGFSLRILIDALEEPKGRIATDQLMTGYGGGQGMTWMYDKRMSGLLEGRFVQRLDDEIALTANGTRIADFFMAVRRFLRLDVPR